MAYEHSEGWGAASTKIVISGGFGASKTTSTKCAELGRAKRGTRNDADAPETTYGYANSVDGVNKPCRSERCPTRQPQTGRRIRRPRRSEFRRATCSFISCAMTAAKDLSTDGGSDDGRVEFEDVGARAGA